MKCRARDEYRLRCDKRRGHADEHAWSSSQGGAHAWPNDGSDVRPRLSRELKDFRAAIVVGRALAVMVIAGAWWGLHIGRPAWGAVLPVPFVVMQIWGEVIYRKERRGLGEAVGDCERAGTATATSTGTNASTAGLSPLPLRPFGASTSPVGTLTCAADGSLHVTLANGTTKCIATGAVSYSVYNNTLVGYTHEQAGEDARLRERDGDLPLLAFKVAQLVWTIGKDFGPALVSVYGSVPWGDSDAICANGMAHNQIPDVHCTCGFYARRSPDDIDIPAGESNVLVDVELYGRVIVYERGYRAQHQRLLRVGLGPCWYCNGPATVVGGNAPVPVEYTQKNGLGLHVATYTEPGTDPARLWPFCDHHVDLSATNLRMPVDELAERLGVPVETVHAS